MRISHSTCAVAATAFVLLGGTAAAQSWADDFDTYTAGSAVDPSFCSGPGNQGIWEAWSSGIGVSTVTAGPPAPVANSLPNALSNNPGCDTVGNYLAHGVIPTSGTWIFEGFVYHPSAYMGRTYWIMLNTYNCGGPYSWSLQTFFDGTQNLVDCDCNNMNDPNGPQVLIRDAWIPIRSEIDLDLDTVDVFYNDVSLTAGAGYGWTTGVFGGSTGILTIQALDLFPDVPGNPQTTEMYYDDLELHPDVQDLGTNDNACVQIPNSNGTLAAISLIGTGNVGDDILGTVSGGVPGQFGYFLSGPNPGFYAVPPGSGGILCIGAPQYRYNSAANMEVFQFDAMKVSQAVVGGGPSVLRTDGTGGGGGVPAVLPGESRAFQAWYRDVGGAFGNSNFSQSKIVQF